MGTCDPSPPPSVLSADAGVSNTGAADSGASSGVQVLFRGAVGPYDSAVIQSSDPAEMRAWLETNGYAVTDRMMEAVLPYVAKGDALLALKLLNGKSSGDIQPIWVTMEGSEVCVPIRLTAIAAIEDMDITTTVFSDLGRAIPENYFHVELNLARIDWLSFGSNYRQLVGAAADEGSGNAFVTEYSGSARVFDERLYSSGRYDRSAIENANDDAASVIIALQNENLAIHPEVAAVLLEAIGPEVLEGRGISASAFLNCPTCFTGSIADLHVASSSVADAVWSRVVEPLRDLQRELDSYAYSTRLYTLLSPEEMMVDPQFAFRTDLPDVSNVHRARAITDCSNGGPRSEAPVFVEIEETGQLVPLGKNASDGDYLDALPASAHIEQLAQGLVVEDHSQYIERVIDSRTAVTGRPGDPAPSTSCGCRSGGDASFETLLLAALAALAALALRIRSRGGARRTR
jgi:MYXO-CTERM domain-containing protein